MNPVLAPKRKQFGFLKPPSSKLPQIIAPELDTTSTASTVSTIYKADQSKIKTENKCFNLITYNFDSLPEKKEQNKILSEKYLNTAKIHLQRAANRYSFDDWNLRNPIQEYNNILKLPILFHNSNYFNKIDTNLLVNQLIRGEQSQKKIIYENYASFLSQSLNSREKYYSNSKRCESDTHNVSWISTSISKIKRNNH